MFLQKLTRRSLCSVTSVSYKTPIIKRKDKGHVEQTPHFIDSRTITVTGGKGGDGCISFSSVYGTEFNGPDGGDGGNGGHVLIQANNSKKCLSKISALIKAEDGTRGSSSNCTGANAPHTIIDVPVGTIIKSSSKETLMDLDVPETMFLAARGGQGGKGNKFFATALHQSPEMAEYGADGESKVLLLEMSTIADFGLVGYPNAGKSSLLRAISRARPKVAGYCFTTLKPHVGIVEWDDGERVGVADIPGLLPLAHKNHGLGIDFLRHIQRCSSLIFVLDFTLYKPLTQLDTLLNECKHFDKRLLSRSRLVVANKIDCEDGKANYQKYGEGLIPISAKYSIGLNQFLDAIRKSYDRSNVKTSDDESIYQPILSSNNSKIKKWR